MQAAFSDQLQGAQLPAVIGSADATLTSEVPMLTLPQRRGLGFHLITVDVLVAFEAEVYEQARSGTTA